MLFRVLLLLALVLLSTHHAHADEKEAHEPDMEKLHKIFEMLQNNIKVGDGSAFDSKDTADWFEKLSNMPSKDSQGSSDTPTDSGSSSVSMAEVIKKAIQQNKVMIFAKSYCPYCNNAAKLFDDLRVAYVRWDLDKRDDGALLQDELEGMTSQRTVPNIFINGEQIGGFDKTMALHKSGKLLQKLAEKEDL